MLVKEKIVFTGADIVTLSEKVPHAQAVCVSNGRIDCVGSESEILRYAKMGACQVIQLQEGTLYPGFIDTHSHLSMYGDCLDQVYCGSELGSITAIQEKISQKALTTPEGRWIIGYGYDDSAIQDNRHMGKQDLDIISTKHPILISHISNHMGYVNTLGLNLLNFSSKTKIPGGKIVLDGHGEPTGFILENALISAFGKLPPLTEEKIKENITRAIADYNKNGITTFQDGAIGFNGNPSAIIRAYTNLDREKKMNARAYLHFIPDVMDQLIQFGLWKFGSDHLTFGGVKYFTDGSIQGFTAALKEGYHSRPDFNGNLLYNQKKIKDLISKYHKMGIQIAVHTNGDAASEAAISSFESAIKKYGAKELHHMLIHAQMVSDSQLERMKACGITPSFFSRHIEVWGDRHYTTFIGPQRTNRLNPAGSCVRLQMPFSLHVDTPVLPVTVLGSMHAAVNRISSGGRLLGADQRISPRQALQAYTVYAASCCGGENDRGKIEPGRLADFVLLDKNIEQTDPLKLRDIQVKMTICGGNIVFQRKGSQ